MISANGNSGAAPEPLVPPMGLFGGHRQTLAAYIFHGADAKYAAKQHVVDLPDGDRIVLHDDCPAVWRPGDKIALMLHGLAGCHLSPYMVRIAEKLNRRGVRTFRMDLRGAGAGKFLAIRHYHSGRSADAATALEFLGRIAPASPVALIGFSLSGNIVLKLAGESAGRLPANLECVAAVSPPIDLADCCRTLSRGFNRMYDRYFVSLLSKAIEERRAKINDLAYIKLDPVPTRLYDFDDRFTAPMAGFRDAADYYAQCSAAQFLHRVEIPALIVAADDDPMIPSRIFRETRMSPAIELEVTPTGGHLGFLTNAKSIADRRWLDARLLHWLDRNP